MIVLQSWSKVKTVLPLVILSLLLLLARISSIAWCTRERVAASDNSENPRSTWNPHTHTPFSDRYIREEITSAEFNHYLKYFLVFFEKASFELAKLILGAETDHPCPLRLVLPVIVPLQIRETYHRTHNSS